MSDIGFIEHEETGARAELVGAVRAGDDQTLLFEGEGFAVGDRVRAVVPWSHRFPTMANHTATHLLHKALQEELGDHVRQAGSAVRPDKLRFDFTHGQALTPEERAAVERRVNEKVFENLPVLAYVVPLEEAKKMGATMLFDEKYGEDVRVIEIPGYSMELCGGTHVVEDGGDRPVRRSSPRAPSARECGGSRLSRPVRRTLSSRAARTSSRRCERSSTDVRKEKPKAASTAVADVDADVKAVEGVNVIAQRVEGLDADALLDLSDRFKQRNTPAAVVLGTVEDGRVHLVVQLRPDRRGPGERVRRGESGSGSRRRRRRRPPDDGPRRRHGSREARRRAGRGRAARRRCVDVLK